MRNIIHKSAFGVHMYVCEEFLKDFFLFINFNAFFTRKVSILFINISLLYQIINDILKTLNMKYGV